jgi:hypothetical protein
MSVNHDCRLLRICIRHPALAAASTLEHVMGLAGTRIQNRPGGLSVLTTLLAANLQGLGLFHGCIKAG